MFLSIRKGDGNRDGENMKQRAVNHKIMLDETANPIWMVYIPFDKLKQRVLAFKIRHPELFMVNGECVLDTTTDDDLLKYIFNKMTHCDKKQATARGLEYVEVVLYTLAKIKAVYPELTNTCDAYMQNVTIRCMAGKNSKMM